jgi:hypothetical protein
MIERGENSIKFKGLSYKIVTGPSGRNWLDRNIGATKVAVDVGTADVGTADASTVDNRNAYGEYYSFDKAICPTGFSVPTKAELKKAVGLLDGPTPTAVSTATVLTGFLKLPAAGLKGNGSVGSEVALWTKTKGASDEYAVLQVDTSSGRFVFRSKDDSILQAFTLSEPYISALVQSKDDAVTVTKFPSVEVMPPSFVSVVPECLN